MEVKANEATKNRPEGNRPIDAPSLLLDLDRYTRQLKSEEAWHKNDRNGITIFKTGGCTMVLTALHEKAILDYIKVNGIVLVQVLEGKVEVAVDDMSLAVTPNQVVTLHENKAHSIQALDESVVLITIAES
jgi:quercetin dioxygenase-like cupin family protein